MKKLFVCLLLVVLFSCPALANAPRYAEGEVLVVVNAPIASEYEVMGVYNENLYSRALSNQAEGFARSRGLEARNTYPEIARVTGKSIIHLQSKHKNTDQLIREIMSDHR